MSYFPAGYSLTVTSLVFLILSAISPKTFAAKDNTQEKVNTVDTLMRHAFRKMSLVGMGIGIVKDGRTVFAKGYGLRNYTDPSSHVTSRTTFQIASCTKAFTTYIIDRLLNVDGIIDWDDLVIEHIPEFRMSNDHTWTHATLRDLCSHATGLPLHERVWIYGNFSRNELLERIPHLETNYELRAKYQYNDMMYAVVGLIIERVTGQKWEDNVHERILKPLNLTRTFTTYEEMLEKEADDVAEPHGVPKGCSPAEIAGVPVLKQIHLAPAGGIWSSVEDLATWVRTVQLRLSGKSKEMHVPQINVPADPTTGEYFGYGLGWRTAYHRGRSYIWHTGGINGFLAHVALFPEEDMGIIVLANLDTLLDFNAHLLLKIADIFMNYSATEEEIKEWVLNEVRLLAESQASTKWEETKMEGNVSIPRPEQFLGHYENGGYGVVEVFVVESGLVASLNSLHYTLVPKKTPDYFSARSPFPRELRFECWFVRDPAGDVVGFHSDLEPMTSPIYFKKMASDNLHAIDYLRLYLGTFGKIDICMNKKKGVLVARGDSLQRYNGKLQPLKRNWFTLKRYFFEFVLKDGRVSELNIHESELITVFKKK